MYVRIRYQLKTIFNEYIKRLTKYSNITKQNLSNAFLLIFFLKFILSLLLHRSTIQHQNQSCYYMMESLVKSPLSLSSLALQAVFKEEISSMELSVLPTTLLEDFLVTQNCEGIYLFYSESFHIHSLNRDMPEDMQGAQFLEVARVAPEYWNLGGRDLLLGRHTTQLEEGIEYSVCWVEGTTIRKVSEFKVDQNQEIHIMEIEFNKAGFDMKRTFKNEEGETIIHAKYMKQDYFNMVASHFNNNVG